MTQEEFEKYLFDNAMMIVPKVICGEYGNYVVWESVTHEQMIQIKKMQGKV